MGDSGTKPLEFIQRDDRAPVCPHCSKELNEVYCKSKGFGFIEGKNVVYFCPHCSKVLGFGQSRMI